VVVQHLPLGGILEWNVTGAPPTTTAISRNHICTATPVPWASRTAVNAASRDALVTAVPWGGSGASVGEGTSAAPCSGLNSHPKV
jgi:hypothetical protein